MNQSSRRGFLCDLGAAVGTLGLTSYLSSGPAFATGAGPTPHFTPRAKRLIFIFFAGGPSHIDLYDPKPALTKYTGQRPPAVDLRTERVTAGLLPSKWKFERCGDSGLEFSELVPNLRKRADDLCLVRSVYAVNPNHTPASAFLATGRIDAVHPGLGPWVSYGLGTENENLPGFVSLSVGFGSSSFERSGYLPGQHQGVRVDTKDTDPDKMIRHLRRPDLPLPEQRQLLDFVQGMNRDHAAAAGHDPLLEARVRAMETAFRMQTAAGEAFDLRRESQAVRDEYGAGPVANACLLARRLVERGVRVVQVTNSGWDHHNNIDAELKKKCDEVDRPVAALLADLKRTGLLDDTLVVCGGEFGRTPVSENGDGRDHNPYGFTVWLAGGGVKAGTAVGATDEFGFRAVENRVSVHDLHATVLHLFGLDHEKLTYRYSGRDFRLTDVHGRVVRDMLA